MGSLSIRICSLNEASDILTSNQSKEYTHLVSIGLSKDDEPLPLGYDNFKGERLRLELLDSEIDNFRHSPNKRDIEELLDFYETELFYESDKDLNFLIHCTAGISRSTAASYILLYMYEYLVRENKNIEKVAIECFQKTLKLQPEAWPNALMIKYADEILESKGNLIQEVKNFKLNSRYKCYGG